MHATREITIILIKLTQFCTCCTTLDLLFGTDLLPKLGCSVVLPQDGGKMINLLQNTVWGKS